MWLHLLRGGILCLFPKAEQPKKNQTICNPSFKLSIHSIMKMQFNESTFFSFLFTLVIGFLLTVTTCLKTQAQCSHPDFDALMALYNSTDGSNWTDNSGWVDGAAGTNCDPCNGWEGVTCASGRVKKVELGNNNLTGILPSEIVNLTLTEVIFLNNNSLNGEIPDLPSNLKVLRLLANDLSGEIPDLPGSLTFLELGGNDLSGEIPDLPIGLLQMNLANNNLSGEIPDLPNGLLNLQMSNNGLSGEIPTLPSSLNVLHIGNNNLSGCFPASLSALCNGTNINLSNSGLPGGGSPAAVEDFCASGGTNGGDGDNDGYCGGSNGSDCDDTDDNIHPGLLKSLATASTRIATVRWTKTNIPILMPSWPCTTAPTAPTGRTTAAGPMVQPVPIVTHVVVGKVLLAEAIG